MGHVEIKMAKKSKSLGKSHALRVGTSAIPVLYEDNHLLVIAKPAGLATMGTPAGEPSLVDLAKDYLKRKYDKPGNVYLGVVSRLDAWVSGALVFARTSKAAARLNQQFRESKVKKVYWALVEQIPAPAYGRWVDWVRKNEAEHRMQIAAPQQRNAQEAILEYRVLRPVTPRGCLLELRLVTGRKHQIRLQLAARDLPIRGDRKYGSSVPFPSGIALHARILEFAHPTRQEPVRIECPLPDAWNRAGVGGLDLC